MSPRSIALSDVRAALQSATHRRRFRIGANGKPLGRVAAYTQWPRGTSCHESLRGIARYAPRPLRVGPMERGDLHLVVERVMARGDAEFYRTFGIGPRAMMAEARKLDVQ